jgi:hypothetical protein
MPSRLLPIASGALENDPGCNQKVIGLSRPAIETVGRGTDAMPFTLGRVRASAQKTCHRFHRLHGFKREKAGLWEKMFSEICVIGGRFFNPRPASDALE